MKIFSNHGTRTACYCLQQFENLTSWSVVLNCSAILYHSNKNVNVTRLKTKLLVRIVNRILKDFEHRHSVCHVVKFARHVQMCNSKYITMRSQSFPEIHRSWVFSKNIRDYSFLFFRLQRDYSQWNLELAEQLQSLTSAPSWYNWARARSLNRTVRVDTIGWSIHGGIRTWPSGVFETGWDSLETAGNLGCSSSSPSGASLSPIRDVDLKMQVQCCKSERRVIILKQVVGWW